MAKNGINVESLLNEYRGEYGLRQRIPCSKQENKEYLALAENGQPLPEGVYRYKYESGKDADEFYVVDVPAISQAEIEEYLTYKKLDLLRTIKNCLVFFAVLTVIGLLGSIILALLGFVR